MPLNLVYFSGGPRERVLQSILNAGHHVERVFVNNPTRWPKVQATIDLATEKKIPVHVVANKADLKTLIPIVEGKICFSAGFSYLFGVDFLSAVKVCINVHGSLLPKYPGARTLSWAIEYGESESGVTVHVVDQGMDTGPIILQRSFPLSQFETTRSLARKTADFESSVVVDALRKFEYEGIGSASAQASSEAVDLPNRIPSHSEIDPTQSLLELFNKIRAADPVNYPAYFYLNGEKVCIKLWRPDKPSDESDLI
ncbi:methionyl-tRNA formyltransferase [Microvirga alba]|uniref:phosphoribosylglycinamide formyltransferase 1 n=1 Tax=Microvirga alba TaxID=2791025 RepID=A0A931FN62_9HYPH|nr:formyltransferase family protein [Microvirga alba]MBF9231982.1 hypothetical protein [Microvirga alba]